MKPVQTSKTFSASLLTAAGFCVLLISGCGEKTHTATTTGIKTLPLTSPEPSTASGTTTRGPRPQEDIEALYRKQPSYVAPRPTPKIASMPQAQRNDIHVVGDAAWDVPLAREWTHMVIHHSASHTGSASIFDRAHKE